MHHAKTNCLYVLALCLISLAMSSKASLAEDVVTDPEVAQTLPDFLLQGEYLNPTSSPQRKGVQVVSLGKELFRVVIYNGGLPGAGWDRKPTQVIAEEDTEGVNDLINALSLQKVFRESPNTGAKPPADAVVLFDGSQKSLNEHWKPGTKMTDDGLLIQGATSTDTFQDYTAHIEFLLPYMPNARGQGRGNSGVYHQGRYETQVLDSFGLEGKNNETGGIYEIRDPDLNMCFPPLTWQTYDVDFTAPRWDEAGKKISNARLTVRLNGVVVQRDIEVPRVTRAAPLKESPEPGPIYIQDHGNPVRFRNIWVLPRDAEAEARRPILPGYERFHANTDDPTAGGLMLLGELGCVKCHQAGAELAKQVSLKQAPILTNVGKRVRPDWMLNFIANPHTSKPGTTMPEMFNGWSQEEKNEAALALTNFLSSTGNISEGIPDPKAIDRGRKLFHEVGCVACHSPQEGEVKVAASTSVPLSNLIEKYSVPSLTEFLKNPHAVRPSGRMPALNLEKEEPGEIAQYLLAGAKRFSTPNVRYRGYHGSWQELPDFEKLDVKTSGTCAGLDTSVAGQPHNFALRFDAFFNAEVSGNYTFWLGSDDGARLTIDGAEIANTDGIHPHQTQEKTVSLKAGVHAIQVDYFEYAGDVSLALEVKAPNGQRQNASPLLTLNSDGSPVKAHESEEEVAAGQLKYRHSKQLISRGKELFGTLGCASCHELNQGDKPIVSALTPKPLANLKLSEGCLSETASSTKNIPNFDLSPQQRNSIVSALAKKKPMPPPSDEESIHQTMATFNCYACHERNSLGGPEFSRNALFITTQHEMGDEGRIPPPLNGVGDKLKENWLKHVMDNGANDRPYMLTRMPKFGGGNIGHLPQAFKKLDQKTKATLATFEEPEHRIKGVGRTLVGGENLACIKCHTFGNHKATGIQALALTSMTKRIREDWFLRYLYEPAKYRPGTRMPTGFPNGKAVIQDVLKGDPNRQISAIWTYLLDQEKAGIPDGLIAQMEELKPLDEPIIYRNFIEGLSPRGIAVGYPEKAHLAWDANDLCLKLIWHGRFIDASKHWSGRGQGTQVPLGDHIMQLEPNIPVAQLDSRDAPWPTESPKRQTGYQFKGYQLNTAGQPTFMYNWPAGSVHDFAKPVAKSGQESTFQRELTFDLNENTSNAYFRAGVGNKIEQTDNGFLIDDAITIRITSDAKPFIRDNSGKQELLVPLSSGSSQITQEIIW